MSKAPSEIGRFLPHDSFLGEDEASHARLNPSSRYLSGRTKRNLRTGKGFLGKEVRGEISDEQSSEASRELREAEARYLNIVDEDRAGISGYDHHQLELLLGVFAELDAQTRDEILEQVHAASGNTQEEILKSRLKVVKAWLPKLEDQGIEFHNYGVPKWEQGVAEKDYIGYPKEDDEDEIPEHDFPERSESEDLEKGSEQKPTRLGYLDETESRRLNRGMKLMHDSHGRRGRKPSYEKGGKSLRDLLIHEMFEI